MNTMCLNTQADQFYEIQSEVKRKIIKGYDKEKPIKNEFMRIISGESTLDEELIFHGKGYPAGTRIG